MIRIRLKCGFLEVVEVVPIALFISNHWELLLRLLILLCYAGRHGLGLSEFFHDRCEIVN